MKKKSFINFVILMIILVLGIKLIAKEGTPKSCKEWVLCAAFDDGCIAERWSESSCTITCATGAPINCLSIN